MVPLSTIRLHAFDFAAVPIVWNFLLFFFFILFALYLYPVLLVLKFVIDFRQVCGFPRVFRFPSPIKTDRHDITEILLMVALNIIKQTNLSYYTKLMFIIKWHHMYCILSHHNIVFTNIILK